MSEALLDTESVLRDKAGHPAIVALIALGDGTLTAAKWDHEELTLTIPREQIIPACRAVQQAGYNFLEDVAGIDWLPRTPRFQVSYHILSHSFKERIRLSVLLDDESPAVDTITTVWPSANYYEREIFDLFGIRFDGHPNLRRILMPDDWNGYPLRKDYPVEGYR
jgi:NADH-quinone oxidoreductase subunit C